MAFRILITLYSLLLYFLYKHLVNEWLMLHSCYYQWEFMYKVVPLRGFNETRPINHWTLGLSFLLTNIK